MNRKSIATLVADSEAGHLRRVLGPGALVLLGIGAIIGAGIFVLTGTVASQNAGPGLVLSMLLAGIACALAGLCYAELARRTMRRLVPVALLLACTPEPPRHEFGVDVFSNDTTPAKFVVTLTGNLSMALRGNNFYMGRS